MGKLKEALSTWDKMLLEESSYRNSIALEGFDVVEFIKISQDEDDYYYKYKELDLDEFGQDETYEVSACVGPIFLKEELTKEEYNLFIDKILNNSNLTKEEHLKLFNKNKQFEDLKEYKSELVLWRSPGVKRLEMFRFTGSHLVDLTGKVWVYDDSMNIFPLKLLNKDSYSRLLYWWELNSREKLFVLLRQEPYIQEMTDGSFNITGFIQDELVNQIVRNLKMTLKNKNDFKDDNLDFVAFNGEIVLDHLEYLKSDDSGDKTLEDIKKEFLNELDKELQPDLKTIKII